MESFIPETPAMNPALEKMIQSGNIPHALLFSGPPHSLKKEAALQFALDILKTKKSAEDHPDIHQYFPEGKVELHPIETIRSLSHEVSLVPFEGPWKIFILHEADKMLPTSSNALLKTLEEPTPQTLIILLTSHPDRLLPTILSRCQTIDFHPTSQKPIDSTILAFLAGELPQEAYASIENSQTDILFETILFWYRDRLLLELGITDQLHFPQYLSQLKQTPLIPLEQVEKQISLASLAYSRSTKLSTCLDMLFLALSIH